MLNLLETTVPVVEEIAKVPIMEFIQGNPIVSIVIGFCLVVSLMYVFKKKRRYWQWRALRDWGSLILKF